MSYAAITLPPEAERSFTNQEITLDARQMAPVLQPLMQNFYRIPLQVQKVDIEVLRQRNKRCVMRYSVLARTRDRGEPLRWGVIGKVYSAESGEEGLRNMRLLWENGFSRHAKDGISMPEPLVFLPELRLLLQEEVPGVSLRMLLKQAPQEEHFIQLARGLAKLHRTSLPLAQVFTVRDHLLRCHPKHEFLCLACPELAPLVDFIVENAYAIEQRLGNFQRTPLHGDFHLGQVHLQNDRLWLIDFDTLSYGDPAADLGNLLVFLKGKALRIPQINRCIDAFLGEYLSASDPALARRIPLYEGLTHLRRACKCLRLQKDNWQEKAAAMLQEGVQAIQEMKRRVL